MEHEASMNKRTALEKTIISSIFTSIFFILLLYLMYFAKIEIIIFMGFPIVISLAAQFILGLIGLFNRGLEKLVLVAIVSSPVLFILVFFSPLTISLRQ